MLLVCVPRHVLRATRTIRRMCVRARGRADGKVSGSEISGNASFRIRFVYSLLKKKKKTPAITESHQGGGGEYVTQPASLPKRPLRSRMNGRNYLMETRFHLRLYPSLSVSYGEDN